MELVTNISSFGFTQRSASVGFLAFTSSHADSDVDDHYHRNRERSGKRDGRWQVAVCLECHCSHQ